jgi:hypothetical protein
MVALPSSVRWWHLQEALAWGSTAVIGSALWYVLYGSRGPPPQPRRLTVEEVLKRSGERPPPAPPAGAPSAAPASPQLR